MTRNKYLAALTVANLGLCSQAFCSAGIEIIFEDGLTSNQKQVFRDAKIKWEEAINFSALYRVSGQDAHLVITASGEDLGDTGILGQAGPTHIRRDTNLPAQGVMGFNQRYLKEMEADGTLVPVITHEMGHVLGLGTLWDYDTRKLVQGPDRNLVFVGPKAKHEYSLLCQATVHLDVPVAIKGGPGTKGGHWRKNVFGRELMTGYLSDANAPLSRVSLAAFEDLGYTVNYKVAQDYTLPEPESLDSLLAQESILEAKLKPIYTLKGQPTIVDIVKPFYFF